MGLLSWRFPRFSLVLIFQYFCEHFFCGLNWWWFVRYEEALFGSGMVNAHLVFVILGSVLDFLLASPFLFWPYRYGPQMPPRTRRNCIFFAMCMCFLFHDFPLWLLEFWFIWQYGWLHIIQGISIFTLTASTAIGFFAVWLGYAWKMSKALQIYWGNANYNVGGLAISRLQGGIDMVRI